jgi:FkbM family methyltransferase
MDKGVSSLLIKKNCINKESDLFCKKFINSKNIPKFIFGINTYAKDIVDLVSIDGFIDDFTDELEYLGKKIYRIDTVPSNALVLVTSGGRIKSAMKRVKSFHFECLDYFSFLKYSNLNIKDVVFNEGFKKEFDANYSKYEYIYGLLQDGISQEQFISLVNFRYSYDIQHLNNFSHLEKWQYFEDFIPINSDECFLDVGSYDGYTSEEFLKFSPDYKEIHVFEPDPINMTRVNQRLKDYQNIFFHKVGLSNKRETLRFERAGSESKISNSGLSKIKVDRLDDILNINATFIKIDIEGAELNAIEGMTNTIQKHHPKIAISVYHKVGDFWRIPDLILNIRSDYNIYLRHYTESIYETVMFFIPK